MSLYKIKGKCKKGDPIAIFNLNRPLGVNNSKKYNNIDDAEGVTLVQKLFYLPFVKSVTLNDLSIEIERFDILEWSDVLLEVEIQIEKYLNKNKREVNSESEQKKVPLSVYAESTPNPSVMKFVANKKLTTQPLLFDKIEQTKEAPMINKLFEYEFVKEVFLDENYISILKKENFEWNHKSMEIREFIQNYLRKDGEIISRYFDIKTLKKKNSKSKSNLSNIEKKIVSILEEYVKPAVASDGGNIIFDSYDNSNKIVKVLLQGACSGCPSSTYTLKNGIENILKDMLPGKIELVEAVNA